eukprot:TRINITY_DN25860_c0_g1_i1.p1 TRINITY_DN25860_c0_g1~~TRINITY_DN25860_c0_g1_i1.p1  ORF type:complete len:749 (+),score=162.76 TRINITY_DN25860_c0_g1_i1:85-2247(+)
MVAIPGVFVTAEGDDEGQSPPVSPSRKGAWKELKRTISKKWGKEVPDPEEGEDEDDCCARMLTELLRTERAKTMVYATRMAGMQAKHAGEVQRLKGRVAELEQAMKSTEEDHTKAFTALSMRNSALEAEKSPPLSPGRGLVGACINPVCEERRKEAARRITALTCRLAQSRSKADLLQVGGSDSAPQDPRQTREAAVQATLSVCLTITEPPPAEEAEEAEKAEEAADPDEPHSPREPEQPREPQEPAEAAEPEQKLPAAAPAESESPRGSQAADRQQGAQPAGDDDERLQYVRAQEQRLQAALSAIAHSTAGLEHFIHLAQDIAGTEDTENQAAAVTRFSGMLPRRAQARVRPAALSPVRRCDAGIFAGRHLSPLSPADRDCRRSLIEGVGGCMAPTTAAVGTQAAIRDYAIDLRHAEDEETAAREQLLSAFAFRLAERWHKFAARMGQLSRAQAKYLAAGGLAVRTQDQGVQTPLLLGMGRGQRGAGDNVTPGQFMAGMRQAQQQHGKRDQDRRRMPPKSESMSVPILPVRQDTAEVSTDPEWSSALSTTPQPRRKPPKSPSHHPSTPPPVQSSMFHTGSPTADGGRSLTEVLGLSAEAEDTRLLPPPKCPSAGHGSPEQGPRPPPDDSASHYRRQAHNKDRKPSPRACSPKTGRGDKVSPRENLRWQLAGTAGMAPTPPSPATTPTRETVPGLPPLPQSSAQSARPNLVRNPTLDGCE